MASDPYKANLADPSHGGTVAGHTHEDLAWRYLWSLRPIPARALAAAVATTQTPPIDVVGRNTLIYQLWGTWTGSVAVEGRMAPDAPWYQIDTAAASGVKTVAIAAMQMRFNFTWASGALNLDYQVFRA